MTHTAPAGQAWLWAATVGFHCHIQSTVAHLQRGKHNLTVQYRHTLHLTRAAFDGKGSEETEIMATHSSSKSASFK